MVPITITGAVLMLPDGPRRLTLRIAGDRIASIGGSPQPGDRIVDLTGYALFPGLINALDVLDLNCFPRFKVADRYEHASAWYGELAAWLGDEVHLPPLTDRLFIGGLKNLLSGATTVVHYGEWQRSLRSRHFPVHIVQRYGWMPPTASSPDLVRSYRQTPPDVPWMVRVAEGTDPDAAQELERLAEAGCLNGNTLLVHGVGLTGEDIKRISEVGAGLVWCPETNRYLLGEARFHMALSGQMALGSGPRITGSLDLLEELKLAAHLSQLAPARLLDLVLEDAARLLHLPNRGWIGRDAAADLIAVPHNSRDPYQTLLDSHRADLHLIMVGGKPRIAALEMEPLFEASRSAAAFATLDGKPRLLARDLARRLAKSSIGEPGLVLR